MIDRDGVTPLSKRPLSEDSLIHSYENNWPTAIASCRETKETVNYVLGPMYDAFLEEHNLPDDEPSGLVPAPEGEAPNKSIISPGTADTKGHWNNTNCGGPAKVMEKFCHMCNATSTEIARANTEFCDRCQLRESNGELPPDWKCFHRPMFTFEYGERIKANLIELDPEEWADELQ